MQRTAALAAGLTMLFRDALNAAAPGAWIALPPLFARTSLNLALLAIGLALECALAWAVFRRGIARAYPGFTALVLFYPLRAAALFVLARSLDADAYNSVFTLLAAAEIPLLAWVCVELTLRLLRRAGGWSWRSRMAMLMLIAIAFTLTWVALSLVPEKQLADRVQLAAGALMLELFGVSLKFARSGEESGNLTRIPAGFAACAAFQFAALAGRAHAMAQHASGEYIAWSYVPACGYLLVVAFWLAALKPEA